MLYCDIETVASYNLCKLALLYRKQQVDLLGAYAVMG